MPTRESIHFTTSGIVVKASGISTITGEVSDLLCEGEIEGLVDNYYTFKGTLGGQGYDSAEEHKLVTNSNGGVGFLRSVYFNEEPILNQENLYNYQNIKIRVLKGGQLGDNDPRDPLILKPELSFTRSINERLRGPTRSVGVVALSPKYYRILNKEAKKLNVNIKFASLYSVEPGKDDPLKAVVEIKVDVRPVFGGNQKVNFAENVASGSRFTTGNLTSAYMKVFSIDLSSLMGSDPNWKKLIEDNSNFIGWELKVTRLTDEATDGKTKSETFVDSIAEVYSDNLSYPNSAIAYSSFDAEFFSEIPSRYYDVRMRKIQIPNGYNPITRRQSGNWNGTFKENNEWSDNPAWCFYDLINNKRFGLGKYIDANLIDKWTLFSIARYCDELVSDGSGGLEPRFSCNLLIQSREEAFKVLNDMASIFRSITYYFAGSLSAVQDSPKNPTYQFTNSNVIDGDFSYSNASRKVRHTVAIVRYNDKDNFYKPAVEYVENLDGINRFGYKEIETTAFGCTSRGQAIRFGRWILATEDLESESVSFKSGPEGAILRPGDVISIVNSKRKNLQRGGRTLEVKRLNSSELSITLDRELEGLTSGEDYTLRLSYPTYNYDSIPGIITSSDSISDIRKPQILDFAFRSSDVSLIEVPREPKIVSNIKISSSSVDIFSGAVWSFIPDKDFHKGEEYRIINISESQDCEFSISAIEYNPLKYRAIELGFSFSNDSASAPQSSVGAPAEIQRFSLSGGDPVITINIVAPVDKENLHSYRVYAKMLNSVEDPFPDSAALGSSSFDIPLESAENYLFNPPSNGRWWFRVFSINSSGGHSETAPDSKYKDVTNVKRLSGVKISSLKIQGEDNPTDHDLSAPTFEWTTEGGDNISPLYYAVSINVGSKWRTFYGIESKTFKFSALYNLLAAQYVASEAPTSLSSYLRSFSIYVEAYVVNDNGSIESSKGDTDIKSHAFPPVAGPGGKGYCFLAVSNPSPSNSPSPYSAHFSIDGSLIIYNLSAPNAVGYYVLYSENSFTYTSFKNGTNSDVKYKKVSGIQDVTIIDDLLAGLVKIYALVVFFDSTDVLKEYIFKNKGSYSTALKALDPESADISDTTWELVKDLKVNNDESIEVPLSSSLASKALGRGFHSWIRIKENGTWVGQGISKVEAVDMKAVYPEYIGYYPFSCVNNTTFEYLTLNNIAVANSNVYYKVRNDYTVCGWMHQESVTGESVLERDLRPQASSYNVRAGSQDAANSAQKLGYRRYRVYLENKIKHNSGGTIADYAVIGTNANNTRYKTIAEINSVYAKGFDKGGLLVNSAVLKSAELGKIGGVDYENYVLADSPWWKHHSAGFGQGWGGLIKTAEYFDVHLGHLVDSSYLDEAFFAVVDNSEGNNFNKIV